MTLSVFHVPASFIESSCDPTICLIDATAESCLLHGTRCCKAETGKKNHKKK